MHVLDVLMRGPRNQAMLRDTYQQRDTSDEGSWVTKGVGSTLE
jgi:hypothetical protein